MNNTIQYCSHVLTGWSRCQKWDNIANKIASSPISILAYIVFSLACVLVYVWLPVDNYAIKASILALGVTVSIACMSIVALHNLFQFLYNRGVYEKINENMLKELQSLAENVRKKEESTLVNPYVVSIRSVQHPDVKIKLWKLVISTKDNNQLELYCAKNMVPKRKIKQKYVKYIQYQGDYVHNIIVE